jgi:hypothetical protein
MVVLSDSNCVAYKTYALKQAMLLTHTCVNIINLLSQPLGVTKQHTTMVTA